MLDATTAVVVDVGWGISDEWASQILGPRASCVEVELRGLCAPLTSLGAVDLELNMAQRITRLLAGVAAASAALYGGYAAVTYARYGRGSESTRRSGPLDAFLPDFEVRDAHRRKVQAPADVVFGAAHQVSLVDSRLARTIFGLRELPERLRGRHIPHRERTPLLEEVRTLGWSELAREPGRHVVLGAVTQPWRADVEFRGLPLEEFRSFSEPGYAKIVWSIEVEPLAATSSLLHTETRVSTTDESSRQKFRRYWSLLSPGVILIRFEMLRLIKAAAEKARAGDPPVRVHRRRPESLIR
jgi:hypothetical protein